MKTVCELRFADGQKARAEVENESPQGEAVITYSGDIARIVPRLETSTNATLKTLFRNVAEVSRGAELSIQDFGKFVEYAE